MVQVQRHLVSAQQLRKSSFDVQAWGSSPQLCTADIRGDPTQLGKRCLCPFVEKKKKPFRTISRLITIDCSLSFSALLCLCATFLSPLLEACTRTLCWHTQQQTSLPLGAECAVEPRVDQAGRKASVSSLPAPPYLLIKELLNRQKLHREQEWSMHSNTIRKQFFSPPPSMYMLFKFLIQLYCIWCIQM